MADADWNKMRLAYIRGKCKSYASLAKKFGVSIKTIQCRATKEKWVEQRSEYQAKVRAKADAHAQEQDVQRLFSLQKAASDMSAELETIMSNAKRELYTYVNQKGEAVEQDVADGKKVEALTRAIRNMAGAMRDLYDIQTKGQIAQIEMAREEMALKTREQERKEKADGEKGQAQEIKITYEGVADMEAYHE